MNELITAVVIIGMSWATKKFLEYMKRKAFKKEQ